MPAGIAGSEISIADQAAAPGASTVLGIRLSAGAERIAGIQFDLEYDSRFIGINPVISDALRSSEKSIYSAALQPGRVRFLMIGLNQNVIPGGELLKVFAYIDTAVPDGSYSLKFVNVVGVDPDGQAVALSSRDGQISVDRRSVNSFPLLIEGVLNCASLLSGPVAPGEFISLLGAGIGPSLPPDAAPTVVRAALETTSVLINGVRASVLYASANEIGAVVPFGTDTRLDALLAVMLGTQKRLDLRLPTAVAAPGIFTRDFTGTGPGAILNDDFSVNSPANPAPRQSVICFFATGLGQTEPPGQDGPIPPGAAPKPVLPVSVEIGGHDAEVLYAGATPGLVSGIVQVNVRIPDDVAPGLSVPIIVRAGEISSQRGVTLAVR